MKLKFNVMREAQPDPFIFKDGDKFYIYVTGKTGVEAYSTTDVFGIWQYEGVVTDIEGTDFWAPSVIKLDDKYYMYVSFVRGEKREFLHVASADSPLGPFKNEKLLYDYFSIDSHVVKTDKGLFLWYAKNSYEGDRIGTRVFVDRLIDPYTVENNPIEKIIPTFDEEIYTPAYKDDYRWHTIEGPFWFQKGEYQYLMYSGGCYEDDTYHIGYSVAKTTDGDLTKVTYKKVVLDGKFNPVLIKNDEEEGTGHHSVIKIDDEYYAFYHARDYGVPQGKELRTARICRLIVGDGIIKAERL